MLHLVDDVHCVYLIVGMFRNSTKGSFLVDLANTSIEIYHYRESMVVSRIAK